MIQVWPDGSAYVEAIQNTTNLGDQELRSGTFETRANGLPKPYSGGFTTTFHYVTASGAFAVRCFTRGNDDLERRYRAITEFLHYVQNDAFCQAEYIADGIRVTGKWWPIIKMQWIAGRQLNAEIEALLSDGAKLQVLAQKFRAMVNSLGVIGVAHGDLQHGNIIVSNGELRLIDYDGIFLPDLSGMLASEFGHRNYQHPQRPQAAFDARLDRFSSLAIYTALVGLASDPTLWARYNNDENILFRAQDFTSGGTSKLFQELLRQPATCKLAEALIAASGGPIDQVPRLEEVIAGTAAPAMTQATNSGSAAPQAPPPTSPAPIGPKVWTVPRQQPPTFGLHKSYQQPHVSIPQPISASVKPSLIKIAVPMFVLSLILLIAAAIIARPRSAERNSGADPQTAYTTSQAQPERHPDMVPRIVPGIEGSWEIREQNKTVGEIVWAANARLANGSLRMSLDAVKSSIDAHDATTCERNTHLSATVELGRSMQQVPYEETNCEGRELPGFLHVTKFAQDSKSFTGSFWADGVKEGDFQASKITLRLPQAEDQSPDIAGPSRHARYSVSSCGGVFDSKTGFTWKLGPNENTTWDQAQDWVLSLSSCDGNNWHMPTVAELSTLYDREYTSGIGFYQDGVRYPAHISPLFSPIGDGSWGWSNESRGETASAFNLNQGVATQYDKSSSIYATRAFAVLSRS